MRHDAACELTPGANQPSCQCAQRAFLATATDDEKAEFHNRRGYDTNAMATWDLPPRSTA